MLAVKGFVETKGIAGATPGMVLSMTVTGTMPARGLRGEVLFAFLESVIC